MKASCHYLRFPGAIDLSIPSQMHIEFQQIAEMHAFLPCIDDLAQKKKTFLSWIAASTYMYKFHAEGFFPNHISDPKSWLN